MESESGGQLVKLVNGESDGGGGAAVVVVVGF